MKLYAEYASERLIDFLRASNYYNLETVRWNLKLSTKCELTIIKAYHICDERNFVLEMVFLLGRMGNNRQALTLIIERLGDVHRVSAFNTDPLSC